MSIWIIISLVSIYGTEVQHINNIAYGYKSKSLCEYSILGDRSRKCIEIKMVSYPNAP